VIAHRSINATTTFNAVDLTKYDKVRFSMRMGVANTSYEAGDFVRAYLTNGTSTIDLINISGSGMVALDRLEILGRAGGLLPYSTIIPDDWTQATFVITSSTNSTEGAERFEFDSTEFRGTVVIPEPCTRGVAVIGLAAAVACRLRLGINCPRRREAQRVKNTRHGFAFRLPSCRR
jgi:hypothetical protein